jgi:hypothetical protein
VRNNPSGGDVCVRLVKGGDVLVAQRLVVLWRVDKHLQERVSRHAAHDERRLDRRQLRLGPLIDQTMDALANG